MSVRDVDDAGEVVPAYAEAVEDEAAEASAEALPETSLLQEETSRIAAGAGIGLAGFIAAKVLGLVGNVLLTRLLGTSTYGLYSLTRSIVAIPEIVGGAGLPEGTARYTALAAGAGDRSAARAILAHARLLALLISTVCALITIALAGPIAQHLFHNPALITPVRVVAVGIVFAALLGVNVSAARGLQVISHTALCRDLLMPGGLVLVGLAAWLTHGGLMMVLVGQLAVLVGTTVVSSVLATRLIGRHEGVLWAPEDLKRLLLFSMPVMFAGLAFFGAEYSDRLLVGGLRTLEGMGQYVAALQWTAASALFLRAFDQVFGPAIARLHHAGRKADLARIFKNVTTLVIIFSLPLSVLMVLLARPLMALFGPGFEAGWVCLAVLAGAAMANVGTGSVGAMVVMSGRPVVDLANIVSAAVLTVGLLVVLVPQHGIVGAAIAHGSGVVLVNLLRLIETRVFVGVHPYSVGVLKPLAAAVLPVVLCVAIWGAPARLTRPDQAVAAAVLFLVLYAGTLLALGLSADQKAALSYLRQRFARIVRGGAGKTGG